MPRNPRDIETGLTDVEREVIDFLALGLTNHEIGKVLFKSEETIKHQMKHILLRMNARNRTYLVSLAWETGLVTIHSHNHTKNRLGEYLEKYGRAHLERQVVQ